MLSLIKIIEPIAESLKDFETLAFLHYLRGNVCFSLGDTDNCLLSHQQAEAMADVHKLPIIQARALSGIADAYYGMGRLITAEQQFRHCIAVCKQHHLIRDITVNQVMIGAILGFLNRFDDAEQMLQETLKLAQKVRNHHAEAMSLDELAEIYCLKNEKELGRLYANQCLQLAKQIGSKRIQCDALLCLGTIDRNEALLEQAYEIASTNPFGNSHMTSWILAVQAWVTEDSNKRTRALQEGEKLLSKLALSHNQLKFYRYAIETCLDIKDVDKAQYFMEKLKHYTAAEPLPWSEFIIQRAKTLIRAGQGETGAELEHDFQELIRQANQSGFIETKASMLTALQKIKKTSDATLGKNKHRSNHQC